VTDKAAAGSLSQWQLIRLRFSRHRLAVWSMYLLAVFYAVALFAPVLAPYERNTKNFDYTYAPPTLPRFNFSDGLHVRAIHREVNPVNLKTYYVEDPYTVVPLGFFVRGDSYSFLGLFDWDVHLLGVDRSSLEADLGEAQPVFFLLGTDRFGQDVFSRLIYASQISLSIGLISIVISFFLGILIGGLSGYYGGWLDNLIQRFIEILNSFPSLPLWMALAAIMPPTWSPLQVYFAITVVLSLFGWTGLARVVRGKILSLREEDYATAARLLGASHSRVIFKHLVPGFTSHIIVSLTLSVPGMILGETALSFLGIGLRPPVVSWGVMLQDCMNIDVVANYPWLLMPVMFIILTVLAFNFLGDGLRDAADPYASR
jgi:peptide/nickel transport system permease protein